MRQAKRVMCLTCGALREVSAGLRVSSSGRQLKCAACNAVTEHRHADPVHTDWREEDNTNAQVMHGCRVVMVEALGRDALLLPEHGIVLVDPTADTGGVARWVADHLRREQAQG